MPPPPRGAGSDVGTWTVLLPVKTLDRAKTRLASFAGSRRADLALALAADTASAVLACDAVRALVAVTDDARVRSALAALGAEVLGDGPAPGLNSALRRAAEWVAERPGAAERPHGATPLAALPADLPALRPDELAAALRAVRATPAGAAGMAFVADSDGEGTTLLAATSVWSFRPCFGAYSRAAHRRAGAVELAALDVGSLRRDVDTVEHLQSALRLGVGPRTRALALELGLAPAPTAQRERA